MIIAKAIVVTIFIITCLLCGACVLTSHITGGLRRPGGWEE